jgi:hypothetical protein
MLNPPSAASSRPRLSRILPLVLIGTLLYLGGLWVGWEAAMEMEPVQVSFDCEPPRI